MSPFEHVATPLRVLRGGSDSPTWSGNFCGWEQFRKTLDGENRMAFPDLARGRR